MKDCANALERVGAKGAPATPYERVELSRLYAKTHLGLSLRPDEARWLIERITALEAEIARLNERQA